MVDVVEVIMLADILVIVHDGIVDTIKLPDDVLLGEGDGQGLGLNQGRGT